MILSYTGKLEAVSLSRIFVSSVNFDLFSEVFTSEDTKWQWPKRE